MCYIVPLMLRHFWPIRNSALTVFAVFPFVEPGPQFSQLQAVVQHWPKSMAGSVVYPRLVCGYD